MSNHARYLIMSAVIFSTLSVQLTWAQEAQNAPAHDLVAADLSDWTIEYFDSNREASTKIVVDRSGTLRYSRSKQPDITIQLLATDSDGMFGTTRTVFNEYTLSGKRLEGDSDSDIYVSIFNKSGGIRFRLMPHNLSQPRFLPTFQKVSRVLGKYNLPIFESYHLEEKQLTSGTERPASRISEDAHWLLRIYEEKTSYHSNGFFLWLGSEKAGVWKGRKSVASVAFVDNSRRREHLGQSFLSQFQLQNSAAQKAKLCDIEFQADIRATFTCDRSMLVKMDVLDELDSVIAVVNTKLANSRSNEQFQSPWQK